MHGTCMVTKQMHRDTRSVTVAAMAEQNADTAGARRRSKNHKLQIKGDVT